MRTLIVALVVLLAGAVGADLVTERVTTGRAESRLAAEGVTDPQVEVAGFPFLTQLLSRHFGDVRLTGDSVRLDGTRAERLTVHATDVDAPSSGDATAGTVRAEGLIRYSEVLRRAGVEGLTLGPGKAGQAKVGGTVRLLGNPLEVVAVCRLKVAGGQLQIRPTSLELADGTAVTPRLASSLEQAVTLSYPLRLRDLPEGLEVRRVVATHDGFRVTLTGNDVTFDAATVR